MQYRLTFCLEAFGVTDYLSQRSKSVDRWLTESLSAKLCRNEFCKLKIRVRLQNFAKMDFAAQKFAFCSCLIGGRDSVRGNAKAQVF